MAYTVPANNGVGGARIILTREDKERIAHNKALLESLSRKDKIRMNKARREMIATNAAFNEYFWANGKQVDDEARRLSEIKCQASDAYHAIRKELGFIEW